MLKTFHGNREIKIGEEYEIQELWDESGDLEELLEDGSSSPNNMNVVEFDIVDTDVRYICNTIVRVTDIR